MVGDPVVSLTTYATGRLNGRLIQAKGRVLVNGLTIDNRNASRTDRMIGDHFFGSPREIYPFVSTRPNFAI
jgi:hypothetical protein